ncbi:MAG: putative signal-transduction protein containing cAMP-binding and domain [Blastococcus sp.]|nr:putative signal-transduction protein containing cAMP-binding and domain [Blastococcus sp.]
MCPETLGKGATPALASSQRQTEEAAVQTRDAMTRDVITIAPDSLVKRAAEMMAERGFAALPVVDRDDKLVGIVAQGDVLRDRLAPDPRLHLRRETAADHSVPPLLVRDVMTAEVRSVEASADIADVARMFVDQHLRSVPVLEHGRTVGIVSRRDLLRTLARPDDTIRADLLRAVEEYTGETGCWDIAVTEGAATVRRTQGTSQSSPRVEERALQELAPTVVGVVSVRVLPQPAGTAQPADASP